MYHTYSFPAIDRIVVEDDEGNHVFTGHGSVSPVIVFSPSPYGEGNTVSARLHPYPSRTVLTTAQEATLAQLQEMLETPTSMFSIVGKNPEEDFFTSWNIKRIMVFLDQSRVSGDMTLRVVLTMENTAVMSISMINDYLAQNDVKAS